MTVYPNPKKSVENAVMMGNNYNYFRKSIL